MTKPKKLEFRPYSLYAPREFIEGKLNEGYNEVAFSYEGRWYNDGLHRISKMCAFFSEDGRIKTYEHEETEDVSVIRALKPFTFDSNNDGDLNHRLILKCIELGRKRKIEAVLQDIIGWEFR